MATIHPAVSVIGYYNKSVQKAVWPNVTSADDCAPISLPEFSATIHVGGTFGGASVALLGSNTEADYAPLSDPSGLAIDIRANGVKAVLENTESFKPAVTRGDSTQRLTIAILFHAINPLKG